MLVANRSQVWSYRWPASNVELLVALPVEFLGLAEWEHTLFSSAVQATEELRDRIRRQADDLKQDETPRRLPEVEDDAATEAEQIVWVPQCPMPDRLWQVYRGAVPIRW